MVLAATAMILAVGVSVGGAMAYFTDSASSTGGRKIGLEPEGKIVEKVDDNKKTISVENTGDTAIYVRVAIIGKSVAVVPETGWTDGGDGYYYYADALAAGESTNKIVATVALTEDADQDVVVAQESCPAIFAGEDGSLAANSASYAGWSLTAKTAE